MTADERFDRMDQWIEELKQMIGSLSHKLEALDRKVEDHKGSLSNLAKSLLDFRQETARHRLMQGINAGTAEIDSRVSSLTKGVMDLGATQFNLATEQWKLRDANFDLLTRVDTLEGIVSRLNKPKPVQH